MSKVLRVWQWLFREYIVHRYVCARFEVGRMHAEQPRAIILDVLRSIRMS